MAADGPDEPKGTALMRWFASSTESDIRYFKALSGRMRNDPETEELSVKLEDAFLSMAESDPDEFYNYTRRGNLRVFTEEVAKRWRDRPLTLSLSPNVGPLL